MMVVARSMVSLCGTYLAARITEIYAHVTPGT
jgi:hypothetical protein